MLSAQRQGLDVGQQQGQRPGSVHPPGLRQLIGGGPFGAALLQRLQTGTDASDATPAVLAMQQRSAEWPTADELAQAWRLDTARPLALLLADIEALPLG